MTYRIVDQESTTVQWVSCWVY